MVESLKFLKMYPLDQYDIPQSLHRIKLRDNIEIDYNYNINLWDFSGDFATYTDVRNEFYKEVTAIIYVFDLTLKRTLESIENWIKEAKD
jgi:GTPase SAR1 family protein